MNGLVLHVLTRPHSAPAPQTQVANLIARVRRGDADAFTALYDAWFDRVYRESQRHLGADEAACLDMVQEVFLRAMRRLPPLPDEATLTVWFRKTVRSCLADRHRSDMRRRRRERARSVAGGVELASTAETAEQREQLANALDGIDPASRRMLELRHHLDWTLDRIGRLFGLTASAVDGRLRRSRDQLRNELEEHHDG